MTSLASLRTLALANWKSGITVALISVPLSIALSIASGAGPVPGIITGIWATLIASLFGGSNYNIIGAAGALTTTLFAATLVAPAGLGAAVLPILALLTGVIILVIWAVRADRFLYYIPSSVMYGFAAGVAFLIAASQLFDATGLSSLKRTGTFLGDIKLFITHLAEVDTSAFLIFALFVALILFLKRQVKSVPVVIPISILGILFGYLETAYISGIDLISLGDKFGQVTGALAQPINLGTLPLLANDHLALIALVKIAGLIALIAVLETLITAKIADKITRTQSSSHKELLGLALANLGSGFMGGLPATGVFIRTGANIKAGATHRMSATIAAVATAVIALIALPFFIYIPMVVIAAILINTAIGLIETDKFKEFYAHELSSFVVALLVAGITVFEDAGIAVLVGAVIALLLFADRVSHGKFDMILNFKNDEKLEVRGEKVLHLPHDKEIRIVTYSIAGSLGYIDSARHAANFRHLAKAKNVESVIIRLRDLFGIDFEGTETLIEGIEELETHGKNVYISSINPKILEHLRKIEKISTLEKNGRIAKKTSEAIAQLT